MSLVFSLIFAVVLVAIPASAQNYELTYGDLVKLIQQNNISSIEELLPLLPENFRSHYTLMYKSRSLQQATFLNPRVIMFGEKASLTCTFNGDPSEGGFDTLECFQFLRGERRFDFRQIQFPTMKNQLKEVAFSASGRTADGSISCAACHGRDSRPNWDSYHLWPGAYGSDKEDLVGDENNNYSIFVNSRSQHPRYKFLLQRGGLFEPYNGESDVTDSPNLQLSEYVGRMNGYRGARILESKVPPWQSLAFAFSTFDCALSTAQQEEIAKSNLPFSVDTNLANIYSKLGMGANEWTTQIFRDPEFFPYPPYEHQSGFSFLSDDVAMAIIFEKAQAGNVVFQKAIRSMIDYLPSAHSGPDLKLFQILDSILPDPDHIYGFKRNTQLVCPELTDLFVREYLLGTGYLFKLPGMGP